MAKRTRRYRVAYAITRTEFYDIDAKNERDAEERAFSEGALVEDGETTNVDACWTERLTIPGPRKTRGPR